MEETKSHEEKKLEPMVQWAIDSAKEAKKVVQLESQQPEQKA
jgi:hypothetical protein